MHIKGFTENFGFEEPNERSILRGWKFRDILEKAINNNCKEVKWEGTYVDKDGIIESIIEELDKKYKIEEK